LNHVRIVGFREELYDWRRWRSVLHPRAALTPDERIDDFEICRVLGKGASGVVYLAQQVSLERQVALKVTA